MCASAPGPSGATGAQTRTSARPAVGHPALVGPAVFADGYRRYPPYYYDYYYEPCTIL